MTSTTFILFYDFSENATREKDLEYLIDFLKMKINICLFIAGAGAGAELESLLYFDGKYANLYCVHMDSNFPFFYESVLKEKENDSFLPDSRNKSKDTFEYILKSHLKYDLVHQCVLQNPFGTSHFMWLDLNISYMFRYKNDSLFFLEWLSQNIHSSSPFIAFPGCWSSPQKTEEYLTDNVVWRFCGAFFLGDLNSILDFCELYKKQILIFIEKKEKMIWDFNFLAWLEFIFPEEFEKWLFWYKADHNDSIIHVSADIYSKPIPIHRRIKYNYPEYENFNAASASFLNFRGENWLNTRFVDYWIYPHGAYLFNSGIRLINNKNVISKLETDGGFAAEEDVFVPVYYKEVVENIDIPICENNPLSLGLEDLRLYEFNNKVKYCATSIGYSTNGKSSIIHGNFDLEKNEILDGKVLLSPYGEDTFEKNWIPLGMGAVNEEEEEELFIYKWNPLEIGKVSCDSSRLEIVKRHETSHHFFHNVRGSTTFQKCECIGGCTGAAANIGVVHFSEEHCPRHYYHFLVVFNENHEIIKRSMIFYFEKLGIEFCIGFYYYKKIFYFWISQHDRDPELILVKENEIIWH